MLPTPDIPAITPALLSQCQPQCIRSLSRWPWVTRLSRPRLSITSSSSNHSMFLTSIRYKGDTVIIMIFIIIIIRPKQ